jgi:hypothetical protein
LLRRGILFDIVNLTKFFRFLIINSVCVVGADRLNCSPHRNNDLD